MGIVYQISVVCAIKDAALFYFFIHGEEKTGDNQFFQSPYQHKTSTQKGELYFENYDTGRHPLYDLNMNQFKVMLKDIARDIMMNRIQGPDEIGKRGYPENSDLPDHGAIGSSPS